MAGVKIGGVALMGGGLLFLWSSYHGASLTGSLRDLLAGKQPSGSDTSPIGGGPVSSGGGGGGPVKGAYSDAQLRQLWTANGGAPSRAATAACIAMHESSGVASATSANPDSGTNVGLWQLDTKGKGSGYTVAQLQNPSTNARLAVMGSANGTDWSAWSTAGMCGV
jgi:Lysozyme like domain